MKNKYWILSALALFLVSASGIDLVANAARDIGFRTIDGSRNNPRRRNFGRAGIKLIRQARANYADGRSEINDSDLMSPRVISNNVAAQSDSILNDRNLSDMIWQWGQFLDHDLDLTATANPEEPAPISVPTGDFFFDPSGTASQTISFNRSEFSQRRRRPRQQLNSITAFVDASNVYGSDTIRAIALRTFIGGRLKTSDGDLLPFNLDSLENDGGTRTDFFIAGDIRANEQVGLTAMHTLFVREHNRKADEIAAADPSLADETIYQMARQHVGALMQVITYNEFLPALLGEGALSEYRRYRRRVNPGIRNEFSTVAYRFGHSSISPQILRLDNDGNTVAEGNLALRDAFFSPDLITDSDDIGELLKGLSSQQMQEIDSFVIDDLRNFLFGAPGSGGLDLASLNIQRGRDHGIPRYNDLRRAYGLARKSSFSEISSNPDVAQALSDSYLGNVNKVDAWVGMLAEDHMSGSVGELMLTIIKDQFEKLRDGDRFWYQRVFSGDELAALEATTLSDVIKRNTQITNLQDNVFFVSQ